MSLFFLALLVFVGGLFAAGLRGGGRGYAELRDRPFTVRERKGKSDIPTRCLI